MWIISWTNISTEVVWYDSVKNYVKNMLELSKMIKCLYKYI